MRIQTSAYIAATLSLPLLAGARPAAATPGLARQYRVSCTTCHTQFPQLNDFGRRFLLNNFRIPGEERKAPRLWERGVPLSVQLRAALSHESGRDPETDATLEDAQVQLAGLVSRRDAVYVHHHIATDDRAGGDLYEGWLQHSFPGRLNLDLRLGQFEQPLAFTPEIQRLTQSEYLVYGMPVGHDDFQLGLPARGVLLSGGALDDGTRFSLSVNQPRRASSHSHGGEAVHEEEGEGHEHGGPHEDEEHEEIGSQPKFGNVFVRVQHQWKGKRIGLFGHMGRAEVVTPEHRFTDHFHRIGIDAEAQLGRARLYGLWLTGGHSNPTGEGGSGRINGGFVGLDYSLHPRWIAYARYDWASAHAPEEETLDQGPTLGVSTLLLQTWRLLLEYQRRQNDRNGFFLATRLAF